MPCLLHDYFVFFVCWFCVCVGFIYPYLCLYFFIFFIFSLGFLGQKKKMFTTILDRKCLTTLQEAFMWFLTSDSKKEKKRGEYFKKLKRQGKKQQKANKKNSMASLPAGFENLSVF